MKETNIETQQDISWHWLLELKLRKTTGVAFQTFFSELMQERYGEDFITVKPYGSLGDKGCDGYQESSGAVYACYGAQNGASGAVSSFIKKMNDDFDKAKTDLSAIMKSWHMTHNIVEGLPVETILEKQKLQDSNPEYLFFFLGKPKITEILSELSKPQREKFLGPAARNLDYQNLQIEEVKGLVDEMSKLISTTTPSNDGILPVSPQKLEYNSISPAWVQVLQVGRLNERGIQKYFDAHIDLMRGEKTAQIFRDKYLELKAQNLCPDTIMSMLFQFIAGPRVQTHSNPVADQGGKA
ncbi:MAG: hypothetical protein COA84_00885 [Robiginitomaculum sp.]|nr:MAG: hypothetical protein COA84_00885 [Robiginitomaculum sp.]